MPTDNADERLTELEIKVTFQDETIKALNEALLELREEVKHLKARFDAAAEETSEVPASSMPHERPPHY
jgi:uncharacterized coiled-coil protein SlyX